MADVIASRTLFMDPNSSPLEVYPWTRVVMADGSVGVEPYFQPFPRDALVVTTGDEINRVDKIEMVDLVKFNTALSFGLNGEELHGGRHIPEK